MLQGYKVQYVYSATLQNPSQGLPKNIWKPNSHNILIRFPIMLYKLRVLLVKVSYEVYKILLVASVTKYQTHIRLLLQVA